MTTLVLPVTLVAGANENVNDLNSDLNAITAWANGSVDATNISNASITADKLGTTLAQQLGVSNVANTGRGKAIIATSEGRTNAAFGTLTTPDQVTGIVLPTDGLIFVHYFALWKESVEGAARAAIFVGANQLKRADVDAAAPIAPEATIGDRALTTAGNNTALSSYGGGLFSTETQVSLAANVTTGQLVASGGSTIDGGPAVIFAAAGTYTISVQYRATSGTVTALDRRLWVYVVGF